MKNQLKQVNKKAVTAQIVAAAVTVLVCAASAAAILWHNRTITQPTTLHMKELAETAAPYESEYRRVGDELVRAKEDYADAQLLGKKKTLLIFDQCYDNLYEAAYPICRKRKVAAVFTLSAECMVGEKGCITVEQYNELLENGWRAAIRSPEKSENYDRYIADMKARLGALGLEMPGIYCFSRGSFDTGQLERIKSDFGMMLYFLDDDLSGFEPEPMKTKDGFFAVPYLYTSRKTTIHDRYLARLSSAEDCSICLGMVRSNTKIIETDRLSKDNTMINLEDIVETIAVRTRYYRSADSYRQEQFLMETEYADKVQACETRIAELKEKKFSLFENIIALYKGT